MTRKQRMDRFRALLAWLVRMKAQFHACTVPRMIPQWYVGRSQGSRDEARNSRGRSQQLAGAECWQPRGMSIPGVHLSPGFGCPVWQQQHFPVRLHHGARSLLPSLPLLSALHRSPVLPWHLSRSLLSLFFSLLCSFLQGLPISFLPALTPPAEGWGARGPRCRAPVPSSCGFRSRAVPRLV